MESIRTQGVASPRHTVILCSILLLIAAAGWVALHSAAGTPMPAHPAGLLFGALAAELGLLYYVWVGIRRRNLSIRELAVQGEPTRGRMLADIAIGVALFMALTAASGLIARWMGAGDTTLVKPLVGAAASQPFIWVILSLAAAVSEELTFRGYLQRQFEAWLRNPFVAIVAQAVLFGVTHGYQGPTLMLRITVLGLFLGLAAWARKSTIPCVVAHFALDVAGGLGLFR
jgi:membrane protease YdiL (CAAX protease family)